MIERLLWLGGGIAGGAIATFLFIRVPGNELVIATVPVQQLVDVAVDVGLDTSREASEEQLAELDGGQFEPGVPVPGSDVVAGINRMALLAATDPERALQQAAMLNSRLARRLAYERIGAAGAANAPTSTLALVESIEDLNLRAAFVASSLAALASTDAAMAIEYLTTIDSTTYWEALFAQDAIARLADADPLVLLEASNRMSGDIGNTARAMALSAYANQDPEGALQLAEDSPGDRERILQAVAAEHAHRDPASVMEWVNEVAPLSRSVAVSALNAIGETDPDQLLEIALRSPTINGYRTIAAVSVESFPDSVPRIADALLSAGEEHQDSVTALLHTWGRTDPQSVIDWMAINAFALERDTWRDIGRTVSQQGAAAAAEAITRIPPDMRSSWYEGIASNLADQHPAEVLPAILGMPQSAGRDRAIGSTLGILLARGEPIDALLLEAFSSPAARDAAIREVEGYVRPGNVHLAEPLVPLIADPVLREQFQAYLDRRRG